MKLNLNEGPDKPCSIIFDTSLIRMNLSIAKEYLNISDVQHTSLKQAPAMWEGSDDSVIETSIFYPFGRIVIFGKAIGSLKTLMTDNLRYRIIPKRSEEVVNTPDRVDATLAELMSVHPLAKCVTLRYSVKRTSTKSEIISLHGDLSSGRRILQYQYSGNDATLLLERYKLLSDNSEGDISIGTTPLRSFL